MKGSNAVGGSRAARLGALMLALGGATLAEAAHLEAQQGVSLEGQSGVALPIGRLGELTDPGPNAGIQIAYHLSPRVTLNVDGSVDLLNGAPLSGAGRAPDMRLWRYGGGVSADLLPSERWALVTSVGAGATRFSSEAFTPEGGTGAQEFGHTYFTSNAGLKLGYALSSRVTSYLGARGIWTATREEDTRSLADLDPVRLQPFSSAVTVPVTLGLNVKTGGGRRQAAPRAEASAPPAPRSDDTRERRETEARRLCEQAEAALHAGDYERARSLYRRAKAEYPGTLCAGGADEQLAKIAAIETIRERVHFEYDRYRITPEAARVLERKAEVLRKHRDLRVVIEGHCDERGPLEYNQVLGLKRADSTKRYLAALGVSEGMFETKSFGKEKPLAAGQNERSWSQNRRAEFVIRNIGAL